MIQYIVNHIELTHPRFQGCFLYHHHIYNLIGFQVIFLII